MDPEEILRQLPPPEVNYTLPEIKTVKPPVALPDHSVEYYGQPRPSTRQLERTLKQIKSVMDNPAVSSTVKLINNLADNEQESRAKAAKASERSIPAQSEQRPAQTASTERQASPETASPTSVIPQKPPPVAVASAPAVTAVPAAPAYPPPTGNLLKAWQTLRKNPGLIELEESMARDRQLAEDAFEIALQLSEQAPAEDGEGGDEGENGETAPAESHDAVLATAMGLYKKQDWKGIKDLFSENPEAGETKDGLRYIIEAEINEAKPNYMQVRRYSDQLRAIDENDAMANYGLALAHYNAKTPNTAKASEHLAIALKAKNPPEGASAFYWRMTFKKFMIPLLLIVAGLVGGIAHVIKKKKAAAIIDLDNPVEKARPEQEAKPQGKLMQKLAPLLDKFKSIFARFKKKPAAEKEVAITSKSSENEPGEEPESVTESDEGEESDEETEGAEEENELEAEDEETIEDEEEAEEDEEESS